MLVGKDTLKIDDVIVVSLENKKLKRSNDQSEGSIFVARSTCSKSISCGNNFDRDNSRSSSVLRPDCKDKQYYYCHKMGYIKFYCKKLKAGMEEFERSKGKGKKKFQDVAIVVQESSSYQIELLIIEEKKSAYSEDWLLDSIDSNHVCCKKEWFDTYDTCGMRL